jgi:hypothetical protein
MKTAYSETAWLPRAESPHGEKWFALVEPGYTAQECRERFTKNATGQLKYDRKEWAKLRKEGWRIVKVKIAEVMK